MTSTVGRPRIPGIDITVRLTDDELAIVDRGVETLALIEEKAPSRAAWLRSLLDSVFAHEPASKAISAFDIDCRGEGWLKQKTPNHLTARIQGYQKIWLRQFECHAQSLDWLSDIYRNEATRLLIDLHGRVFNRHLELRLLQIKKSRQGGTQN